MNNTAKLLSNNGTYTVIVKIDGEIVERDWTFKKREARKILANFAQKYSISESNIVIA